MTVEELTQITTANTLAIAEINKTQAETAKSITQLTNVLFSLHDSVKILAATVAAHDDQIEANSRQIAQLVKEWQAYLTREKRN